jgi:hypothetical protein
MADTGSLRKAPPGRKNSVPCDLITARCAKGEIAGLPLNPLADTKGCKLLVLRRVTAIVTKSTAYNALDTSLLDLL